MRVWNGGDSVVAPEPKCFGAELSLLLTPLLIAVHLYLFLPVSFLSF